MGIEFDVEKLIGNLDIIQKTQIPFAAKQALKQYGFLVTKKLLPAEMKETLDAPTGTGQPIPYTLRAFRYEADEMSLRIYIPDDKPKEYLYPAFYGGKPKRTKLQTSIEKATLMFGVPAYGNLRALGKLTQYADIKPSYAKAIAKSLADPSKPFDGGRLVVLKESKGRLKSNQIFRVKGSSIIRLFSLFKKEPDLSPALPYEKFVTESAKKRLPSLLDLQLQRAMASR